MICPEYDVTGSNRLVLGHVHELHYVSLIPQIGGKDVWLYYDSRVDNSRYQVEDTGVEQLAEPLLWQLIRKDAGKKQDVFYSYVQFYNPSMLLLRYK